MNAPHLLIAAGFGEGGKGHRFEECLSPRLKPRSVHVVETAPLHFPCKPPEKSIHEIRKAIQPNTILVGDCAGSLLALAAACREGFDNILKLFLVYGPLNPHVAVKPHLPFALPFLSQYRHRVALATASVRILEARGTSKIVTFGNLKDRTVPPAAKRLPGDFQDIAIADQGEIDRLDGLAKDRGIHIVLPFKGHLLRPSVAPERLALVGDIIAALVD